MAKSSSDVKRKTKNDDAAKRSAEALEQTNADLRPLAETPAPAGEDVVYVFANLQSGQSFTLADGTRVGIEGFPVSRLKDAQGRPFAGGKYGVTRVPAAQWVQVEKIYGQMKIFRSGLVFAAPSLERGTDMARERGGLRHGYEPVDPESKRTKTSPKTEE